MKSTGRTGLALILKAALVLVVAAGAGAAPFAYIPNRGSDNYVSVIDTLTNTIVAAVPLTAGAQPVGVAATPDGKSVYVTSQIGDIVSMIDTAMNTVKAVVHLAAGAQPNGVAVSPDSSRVYVADSGNNTVSVIDTTTNAIVAAVPVGSTPVGVDVTPDGKSVYVANTNDHTISVIATATNAVAAIVTLPGLASSPFGVAVTPNGAAVYVTSWGDNTVYVIATASNSILTTVSVGPGPRGVAVTPNGAAVYVTNENDQGVPNGDSVSVIDTATNKVKTVVPLPAGSQPIGVAVTPDGSRVYVADLGNTPGNSMVSVIDTATNTVVTAVPVGINPVAFGKFIGGKPDPVLTDVPKWNQTGIPDGPCYPPNTPPNCFPRPGNFFGVVNYDSEVNTNVNPPVPYTIAQKGCALTALTIVVNYWQGNRATPMYTGTSANVFINPFNGNVTYPGLDPSQVNNWDGIYAPPKDPNNSLDYGNVILDDSLPLFNAGLLRVFPNYHNVSSYDGFPVLYKDATQTTIDPYGTLDNILRNGAPVILPIFAKDVVDAQGNEVPIHFVVVTGKTPKGDYYVNDPGDRNSTTLNTLQSPTRSWLNGRTLDIPRSFENLNLKPDVNNFYVFVRFDISIDRRDPNTRNALSVSSNAPVEFLLTDPQGHRAGYDPVSKTLFEDIPVSAYTSALFEDEQTFTPDGPPFKILGVANQMAGQYTLNVIGTGSGRFTVAVRASDAAGNWITQTYSGTAAPGVSSQFTFQGGVTTFAAFTANPAISPSHQAFGVDGTFTLGPGGTISPVTQPVTVQLGKGFLVTIPAGSFEETPQGTFVFGGVIQGVLLAAALEPTGGNSYAFAVAGAGALNLPISNPVDVRLAIGSNGGSTSVNATFVP